MKSLLIQFNVTRACNLRCTHCYISKEKKSNHQTITGEAFSYVLDKIGEFILTETGATFSEIDLHVIGGEPTMLGEAFYEKNIRKLIEMSSRYGRKFNISIVSNLATKESLRSCMYFDSIATSYEFDSRFVSTKGRPLIHIQNTWLENINVLLRAGKTVNVTSAITKPATHHGAAKLLDYLYSIGFRGIHLGFFVLSGEGDLNKDTMCPTFSETSDFLIDAYEWYKNKVEIDPLLYVNPVESIIKSISTHTPNFDISCPIISGSIDIDANGDIRTCTSAGGEEGTVSFGNVFKQRIEDIYNGRLFARERALSSMPNSKCYGCHYIDICRSGCKIMQKHWDGVTECPGFRSFMKYVDDDYNEHSTLAMRAIDSMERWRSC